MSTVKGKSKLCSTPMNGVSVENIGGIPFYDRYIEFDRLLHKYVIDRRYSDAFAEPLYNQTNGSIDWYIPNHLATGTRLCDLKETADYDSYARLRDSYIQYFKRLMLDMPEHDRQYFDCMIKYAGSDISDHTTFCSNGKIIFGVWGMKLLDSRDISTAIRTDIDDRRVYSVSYSIQGNGRFTGVSGSIKRKHGHVLSGINDIPNVLPDDGYEFTAWEPDAPHNKVVDSDLSFTAVCTPIPQVVPEEPSSPLPPVEETVSEVPSYSNVKFDPGLHGKLKGASAMQAKNGTPIDPSMIPSIKPKRGYEFMGWDKDTDIPINQDTTFKAQYKEIKQTGFGGFGGFGPGGWFSRGGCLNWLIGILLTLLLLFLLSLLLRTCASHEVVTTYPVTTEEVTTSTPAITGDEGVVTGTMPAPVVEGELEKTTETTTTNTEVDYEAVRALIQEYQERIDELVKMLPENEKK